MKKTTSYHAPTGDQVTPHKEMPFLNLSESPESSDAPKSKPQQEEVYPVYLFPISPVGVNQFATPISHSTLSVAKHKSTNSGSPESRSLFVDSEVMRSLGFVRSSINRGDEVRAKFRVEFKRDYPPVSAAVSLVASDASGETGSELDKSRLARADVPPICLEDGNGHKMSVAEGGGQLVIAAQTAIDRCGGDSKLLVEVLTEELRKIFPAEDGVSAKAAQSAATEFDQVAEKSISAVEREMGEIDQFILETRSLKKLLGDPRFGEKESAALNILDRECLYRASKLLNGVTYAVRKSLEKSKQAEKEKVVGKSGIALSTDKEGDLASIFFKQVLSSFSSLRLGSKKLFIKFESGSLADDSENRDKILEGIKGELNVKIKTLSSVIISDKMMAALTKKIVKRPAKKTDDKKIKSNSPLYDSVQSFIKEKASVLEVSESFELNVEDLGQIIDEAIKCISEEIERRDSILVDALERWSPKKGDVSEVGEIIKSEIKSDGATSDKTLNCIAKLKQLLAEADKGFEIHHEDHGGKSHAFSSSASEAVNSHSYEADPYQELFGVNDVFGKRVKLRAVKYLVNYSDLRLNFYVENRARVPTHYGDTQKDHVTAYSILLQGLLSSFPSFYRGRDFIDYLEGEFESVLNPSEVLDQKKRDGLFEVYNLRSKIESLPDSSIQDSSSDKKAALKLWDGITLRCVADEVCEISESFLREINSDRGGAFDQGGQSNKEREAAEFIVKISDLCSLINQEKVLLGFLKAADECGKKSDPELEKFPQFLSRVREKIAKILESEKVIEGSDGKPVSYSFVPGVNVVEQTSALDSQELKYSIEIEDGNKFVEGLAKAISDSIDLRYGYLRKWTYAQWRMDAVIEGDSKDGEREGQFDDYFYKWTVKLIARHLRVMGLILRSLPNEAKTLSEAAVDKFLKSTIGEKKEEEGVLEAQKKANEAALERLQKDWEVESAKIKGSSGHSTPEGRNLKLERIELSIREEKSFSEFFEFEKDREEKSFKEFFANRSTAGESSFDDLASRVKAGFRKMLDDGGVERYLMATLSNKYPSVVSDNNSSSSGIPAASSAPAGFERLAGANSAKDVEVDI